MCIVLNLKIECDKVTNKVVPNDGYFFLTIIPVERIRFRIFIFHVVLFGVLGGVRVHDLKNECGIPTVQQPFLKKIGGAQFENYFQPGNFFPIP